MYIHFDFDSWSPWLMSRDLEKGIWHISKMVPPGKSHYFFSAGGVAARGAIASDHLFVKRARPKFIKRAECSELEGDPPKVVKYNMNFTLYRLNFLGFGTRNMLEFRVLGASAIVDLRSKRDKNVLKRT